MWGLLVFIDIAQDLIIVEGKKGKSVQLQAEADLNPAGLQTSGF